MLFLNKNITLRTAAASTVMFALICSASYAADEDSIAMTGAIQPGRSSMTIEEIEALGTVSVTGASPHNSALRTFEGVWLHDLVAAVGSDHADQVTLIAIDYYQATFTRSDWENVEILLATRENGKLLELENRGPMRVIVADYDATKQIHQETIPKWVWMITEIHFSD